MDESSSFFYKRLLLYSIEKKRSHPPAKVLPSNIQPPNASPGVSAMMGGIRHPPPAVVQTPIPPGAPPETISKSNC